MINWTNVNDHLPVNDDYRHYLVITIEGFVSIQQARYYSSLDHGSGYFLVDGKIVDATYWSEANFPMEYEND